MTDLDHEIAEALDAEEKELMDQFGEQGLFAQWFSIYRGPQAWITILTTLIMLPIFGMAIYAGIQMLQAGDGVQAIKWGAGAWFLMNMVAFMKVWFWMRMESNRVLREVKRVELQVARLHLRHTA